SFYWAIFAAALVILGNLLWNRGVETNLRNRFRLAGSRFTKPTRLALSVIIILLAGTGSTIYYNTSVLNGEALAGDSNAAKVAYEKKYKKYEQTVQPKITDVKIDADLYPEEGKVDIRGRYLLQNKANHAIDSLHVRISGYSIGTIKIAGRVAPPILADPEAGYYIYALHAPLMPGKQVSFEFDLRRGRNGFSAIRENTDIVKNGTFFNNEGFPAFGYSRDVELANNQARRKYGLPTRPRFPDLHDQEARQYSIIGKDADWITFEATVSTIADQIAFAPGTLRKTWMENERRYFHYRTDTTMVNFYPILSGRYEVREDRWRDVKIEIFYHKDHPYNIDRMIKSIKSSLAYYTSNFTPYPHRQIRVIEFPRYVRNAQAFASTIPYSEAIGFVAKIEEGDIDYPFYIIAHEMAHQWWGHQLVGANMQGTALLSETLSEYSAMMVMEKEYGSDTIQRILRFALDDYLKARSAEKEKELPLYRVEFQPYLNYRKGSLAMYALKGYIGEQRLNEVLRAFLEGAAFQGAPYPNALELLFLLKKATPDTLHSVMDDLFKKITLYENRVAEAESQPLANGRYAVKVRLNARKLYADSLGVETETEMADWIDVGIFAEEQTDEGTKEIQIYLRKHKLKSGENTLTLEVPRKPVRVSVDPYYKLIDRNPDDNVASIDVRTK
ncbi:MAG: M1 family aminopeptidase, partial [Candidatus Poribacteria bacterium]|nr:M1 family aminopeptidase [Candidatus Poribacteria bacterium]